MNDREKIEAMIRDGMYVGNRHKCRRDVGRFAGGYLAAGRLLPAEAEQLRDLAVSLSSDGAKLGAREWDEAVSYGQTEPLPPPPPRKDDGHAIEWNEIVDAADYKIVDHNWLENEAVVTPPDSWNPCAELAEYITAVFEPGENVAFLVNPPKYGDKYQCVGGVIKPVDEILHYLAKGTQDGLEEAVGTPNPESGAWIVINPVDGKGRKDANITSFRHALIECDGLPVEEQVAIYKKLELPCTCIVHSGGKSAHAVVRIDASGIDEYRKRVDFLFQVCEQNGLQFDKQNRNPSRFTRMPGFIRGAGKQFIISRACGKSSWNEWENWIHEQNDNLPDFETLTLDEIENPPKPLPELIEGVLSQSSKMIIAGPSKAGKSFLLIELAIAIAEGREWIGHQCRQGRVLYVNLELHRDSCTRRFSSVYRKVCPGGTHHAFIDRWNLRGFAEPMDRLAPKLIRRAKDRGYSAIIIDPIYKVLTGDENNARDMAEFMRHFDRISYECGCSVIFCHHHSKGFQGEKSSLDRASGSGVFVRDTDALVDMTQLDATAALPQLSNRMECEAMLAAARCVAFDDEWQSTISEDDKLVANRLINAFPAAGFDETLMADIRAARAEIVEKCKAVTAWKLSYTLRDFATPQPLGIWFMYPEHLIDEEALLDDCKPQGSPTSTSSRRKQAAPAAPKISKAQMLKNLVDFDPKEEWTVEKAASQLGVSLFTIYRYCNQLGWKISSGKIIK